MKVQKYLAPKLGTNNYCRKYISSSSAYGILKTGMITTVLVGIQQLQWRKHILTHVIPNAIYLQ
jgi:hypothetical protein